MTVVHAPSTSSVTDTAEELKELSPFAGERKENCLKERETIPVSRPFKNLARKEQSI